MFFKRSKDNIKCEKCKSPITEDFSFCPYCGNPMLDAEKEMKKYGMLGRTDAVEEGFMPPKAAASGGIADKLFESILNSLMKSMEKQLRESSASFSDADIKALPNGVKITLGQQPKRTQRAAPKKTLSPEQMDRIAHLPRVTAKTSVRRLGDKVVYELSAPGIASPDDIFISKLEQGYEIKAIGKKKVYVNSLPLELPIKNLTLDENKLVVEFKAQ